MRGIPAIPQEDGVLACPECKGTYLRHGMVDVYSRVEDAETGSHCSLELPDGWTERWDEMGAILSYTDDDLRGNTSPRRGSVVVAFECENCGFLSRLAINQHKGQTFLYWPDVA